MRRKHKPTRIRRLGIVPECVPWWMPTPADTPELDEPGGILDIELCDGGQPTEGK